MAVSICPFLVSPHVRRSAIDVDPTALEYNFIGNDRKPFKVCTWLASKAVPGDTSGDDKQGSGIGGAAGFLFYQTRDYLRIDKVLK